jgi:hypothetical protein
VKNALHTVKVVPQLAIAPAALEISLNLRDCGIQIDPVAHRGIKHLTGPGVKFVWPLRQHQLGDFVYSRLHSL